MTVSFHRRCLDHEDASWKRRLPTPGSWLLSPSTRTGKTTTSMSSSSSSEESSVSSDDRKRKRKRSHKSSTRKADRKRSASNSRRKYDESDEESESSSIEEKRHSKKRRSKDRSPSSSESSYSSSDRRKKRKAKRKDKDKKRKREKKKKKKRERVEFDDDQPYFGKYGLLRASDYHKNLRGFTVWLEEVKGVTDAPKYELQNYFKDYMEDFNTATLPHRKYYDYDQWEMEEWERNKKMNNAGSELSSARKDEARHMQILKEKAEQKRKEELELVRSSMSKEKRDEMKRKTELQAEMAHAYKMGDQETYLKLKNRLEPEK